MYDLDIEDEQRFTEEVLTQKSFEDADRYAVNFDKTEVCVNSNAEYKFFVENTSVCYHCYYRELALKLRDVAESRRKAFVIYQMKIRRRPMTFLKEFRQFITDNSSYLNELGGFANPLSPPYYLIIEDLRTGLQKPIKEKCEMVLIYINELRHEVPSISSTELQREFNYFLREGELKQIINWLEQNMYIKVAQSKDGAFVSITTQGIMNLEQPVETATIDQTDKLADLYDTLDQKLTDLKVVVTQGDAELADLIEELQIQFTEFSKTSIVKTVKRKVGEMIVESMVSELALKPLLAEGTRLMDHLDV